MIDRLRDRFPNLMGLLDGPRVAAEVELAAPCFREESPFDCITHLKTEGRIGSSLLTYHLLASLGEWGCFDPTVAQLELDLIRLASYLPDPVRYEIAAAAIACDVLEPGSLLLEEPIAGSDANPDVTGRWDGQRARMEVTVVHDDWPPSYSVAAEEEVKAASVPGGFQARLNIPLASVPAAKEARAFIERIHAEHPDQEDTKRTQVLIGGFKFEKSGRDFYCWDARCPVGYVGFHGNDDREVQGSCFTRSTVTRYESDDLEAGFPTPPGVVVLGDAPRHPASHRSTPAGQKIYQILEGKLRQCEPGAINVVVLGQPKAANDRGVDDALLGSPLALVRRADDGSAAETIAMRTGAGPFVVPPAIDLSQLPTERQEWGRGQLEAVRLEAEKFTKLSGILVLRIEAGQPVARVILNPNAAVPITDPQAERLRDAATQRVGRVVENPRRDVDAAPGDSASGNVCGLATCEEVEPRAGSESNGTRSTNPGGVVNPLRRIVQGRGAMMDGIHEQPHYEVQSTELAAWLERQGDAWWNVDGDSLLTGLLTFPSPGDELAAVLRRLDRPLLVQDRRADPKGKGERIDSTKLDELVTSLGNNLHMINGGAKPAWASDRLFFLSWKGSRGEWMLVEDRETTESNRMDAAAAGKQ
ncbi:MAG: hypothetical protein J0I06_16955 [Planctomycetes bacterium]|nr:hypothetical protein [Planctomycetota bacterium]